MAIALKFYITVFPLACRILLYINPLHSEFYFNFPTLLSVLFETYFN